MVQATCWISQQWKYYDSDSGETGRVIYTHDNNTILQTIVKYYILLMNILVYP